MRFNVIALSAASGLFWGAAILVVASASLIWPDYGRAFLELAASVYPGYRPGPAIGSVITGTLYAVVDGAIAGAIPTSQVVGCVVHLAASMTGPGLISHTMGARLILGEPGGAFLGR